MDSIKHPDAQSHPNSVQMKKMAQTNLNGTDTYQWDQKDDESNEVGSKRYTDEKTESGY